MPSKENKLYGLLGFPLGHSFSKTYFKGRLDYHNFEYQTVEEFINAKPANLAGFNVTIPHKQNIIALLDTISPQAKEIGAVNCVKIIDNKLHGYNTDCYGFEHSLLAMLKSTNLDKALVLGSGGASKAICYALNKLGIRYKIVSRNGALNYSNITAEIISQHRLIINTTPLGMYPHIDQKPDIPYCALTKNHYLYDLVYNPAQTTFLKLGLAHGATVINGLEMLRLQAEKSFEIWKD